MRITDSFTRVAAITFAFATSAAAAIAQQVAAPQLVVTGAAADPSGTTVTITGSNFGPRPFVVLELVPLPVQVAVDTQIVATAPVNQMPPGEYLLTVSRGPLPAEIGSFVLKLGNAAAASPGGASTSPAPMPAGSEPAAKVGDRVITIAEVDEEWRRTNPTANLRLRRDFYDARRRIVDKMIEDELLAREAAARRITVDALLKEEIPKRRVPLPDSAVTSLYQELGDTTRGASLEQMRPALRAWLEKNTEPELARMNYIEELKKTSTRAELLLVAPRVQVEHSPQDPALGPATAPIEIVAFGDFQSSAYARFAQAFGKVRDTFGDRVRLVFKHLPALGPESMAAAEAAQCANAQGKFWPFHDALLAHNGAVTDRVRESVAAAGLARAAFEACVDRGEARAVLTRAADEAERYGIDKSPSFLVNGQLAPDPPPFLPPFEFFKRIIEEELSHQTSRR